VKRCFPARPHADGYQPRSPLAFTGRFASCFLVGRAPIADPGAGEHRGRDHGAPAGFPGRTGAVVAVIWLLGQDA